MVSEMAGRLSAPKMLGRRGVITTVYIDPSGATICGVARLGRKETVFEPCYRVEELIDVALDAEEYGLLQLVDGRRTLFEICTQGPHSAADNGKVLYAFQVLQLIRRIGGEPAPRPMGRETGAIKIKFKTHGDKYGGA